MSRIVYAKVDPGSVRLSNYAKRIRNETYFLFAHSFLMAGLKVRNPVVRAHLVGLGLELLLKTYLLTVDTSEKRLKKLGHRLAELLTVCKGSGLNERLPISVDLESDVNRFSNLYVSKRFQYYSADRLITPTELPSTRRIERFARALHLSLCKELGLTRKLK